MAPPLVTVFPTKRVRGLGSLTRVDEDVPDPSPVLDLDEALARSWATDAHFVCYLPWQHGRPDVENGAWRLRMEILQELRASGGEVICSIIAIDLDNPGHAAWTGESLARFDQRYEELREKHPDLMPACAYRTTHGARFIYVTSAPLVCEEAEDVQRGLFSLLEAAGWTPDRQCADWTRMFRLPLVEREGEGATGEQPYFWLDADFDRVLQVEKIPRVAGQRVAQASAAGVPNPASDPKPDRETAIALVERRGGGGKPVMTEFAKRARHLLSGRPCYSPIFEHGPLAPKGERDVTMMSMVGQAAALLHDEPGYTPDHLYGLFVRAAEALEPDEGTPDWTDKLWYAVGYCWRQQEAAAIKRRGDQIVAVQQQADLVTTMTTGMARWCKAPELADPSSPEAQAFMLRHLLVSTGRSYYIMGPDGWYSGVPILRETHIPARIRESGLDSIIPLVEPEGRTIKPVPIQKILNGHLTFAKLIEGSLEADRCYVLGLDTEDSRFVTSLFRLRTDIKPEFNPFVHQWLELLVGEDRIDDLQRWIAWALDFREGPICALSLAGPPAVGKKMLAMGLAETITTERIAPGTELVQPFPQSLLETCFMCVDEGLPNMTRGGLDIADNFRRLVGGDPQLVDRKFLDKILVRNPMRIIFTANNLDVVQQLARHRNLSADDQAAIAQRIMHFNARQEAASWLRSKGGTRFTRGWIRGDSGEPSAYVVAKHFLFLYEQRDTFARDSRLLVEGRIDQVFLEEMRANSGSAPLVIETLVRMIEARNQGGMDGLCLERHMIHASAAGVVDHARTSLVAKAGDLDHRKVAHVFRGLAIQGFDIDGPREMKALSGRRVKARWWRLDPVVLLREAIKHGLPNERLLSIVKQIDNDESRELVQYVEASRGEE